MKRKPPSIKWLDEPEDKDYPAALSYLALLYDEKQARSLVGRLKRAGAREFAVKDILRASDTLPSEVKAFDWGEQMREIRAGTPLSPLLLVRRGGGGHLIVADGFHRLCALFSIDEDAIASCRIV